MNVERRFAKAVRESDRADVSHLDVRNKHGVGYVGGRTRDRATLEAIRDLAETYGGEFKRDHYGSYFEWSIIFCG